MEAATSVFSSPTPFPITSRDALVQSYVRTSAPSMRKRKPVVTYQSPGGGIVDMGLLVRNTALEFEAVAAAAAALRSASSPTPASAASPQSTSSSTSSGIPDSITSNSSSLEMLTRLKPSLYRPMSIPRAPPRLYHPFSRSSSSKSPFKAGSSTTSLTSQKHPLAAETGRRSSSRTRRPAPKVRDTESLVDTAKAHSSPAKRKRGGGPGGRRKRTAAQQEADGDSPYPAVGKRTRKPRERNEMDVDGDSMPPPNNDASPPGGYSTRAKKPRTTRAESSASDTGSVARMTPVNGQVEEFWVPTKAT